VQCGAVLIAGGIAFAQAGSASSPTGSIGTGPAAGAPRQAGRRAIGAATMAARVLRAPLLVLGCMQAVGLVIGGVSVLWSTIASKATLATSWYYCCSRPEGSPCASPVRWASVQRRTRCAGGCTVCRIRRWGSGGGL